ncbi:hypothetical protein CYMTET_6981 [Cymbomonas tetramitiformis]|uniref:Uncharacterized protein n=1 Tax=Cymbomonas tetramitiformis TaxID=36881 RepID=A0AAE0GVZ2_9CHLO|nr:hypothetical protein CYMTET_6981 [Cymbomonas tetramitiformis]
MVLHGYEKAAEVVDVDTMLVDVDMAPFCASAVATSGVAAARTVGKEFEMLRATKDVSVADIDEFCLMPPAELLYLRGGQQPRGDDSGERGVFECIILGRDLAPAKSVAGALGEQGVQIPLDMSSSYHRRLLIVQLIKEVQFSKAMFQLDQAALAPLTDETVELRSPNNVRGLQPVGADLLEMATSSSLVMKDGAFEEEFHQLPVASGPGISQLRFEQLRAVVAATIMNTTNELLSMHMPRDCRG